MEDKLEYNNEDYKNVNNAADMAIPEKISIPCCCHDKWYVIVLVVILIIVIMQMGELLRISEALKNIDMNIR